MITKEFFVKNWNNKDLIALSFEVEANDCPTDISVSINGIKNVISCKQWKYNNNNNVFKYVLDNKNNKLEVTFSKGKYKIKNINFYIINKTIINNKIETVDKPKTLNIKNNKLYSTIDVSKKDSYILLSIPYDKGFTIYVDDRKTNYDIVNVAFIGFKIGAGKHKIEVEYSSPLSKEGAIISISAIVLFCISFKCNKKKGKKSC